ncbi:MAG: peptide/nickel transport system permease protein [Candidatus Aldehydirespiratoraceae bacterium]|jgi:peptide/nickel transport system permease protein
MRNFIFKRVLQLVLVLFAVTFSTFASLNWIGSPLENIVGPIIGGTDCDAVERGELPDTSSAGGGKTDCELVREAEEEFNLDRPVPIRYGIWVGEMARGDFGNSLIGGTEISELVSQRLPRTLKLVVYAQIVALGLAIPWGVSTARRANRGFDRVSTIGSFGLLSIPNFALGVVLLYAFSFRWNLFPSTFTDGSIPTQIKALTLPAFTLGLGLAATYQRLLRTDLITTLQDDFVHMARAKGMPPRHIMYRHALRPSLFSVITVFGVNTGALIGGSLVIEQIFGIQGIGALLVTSVLRQDQPTVVALISIVAVGFVVINFLVDLLYGWLDPRVRAT